LLPLRKLDPLRDLPPIPAGLKAVLCSDFRPGLGLLLERLDSERLALERLSPGFERGACEDRAPARPEFCFFMKQRYLIHCMQMNASSMCCIR
jgi:hypothetical protein